MNVTRVSAPPLVLVSLAATVALALLPASAAAADFQVNSTADAVDAAPGSGGCATSASECTLRAAVEESNATAAGDRILLPAGTYALTTAPGGVLDVKVGDLEVVGAGAATTIIKGPPADRIFDTGKVEFVLSGVTVRDGTSDEGGGLRLEGPASLTSVVVTDNISDGDNRGGGIAATGALTITNSTVSSNRLTENGDGGGIYAGGALTITDSTVSGNGIDKGGDGGGIYANGKTLIENTTIEGNDLPDGGDGGGVAVQLFRNAEDTFVARNSTVSGNSASRGGGIFAAGGAASLSHVTITGNTATETGAAGGLSDDGVGVKLSNTIIARNTGGPEENNNNALAFAAVGGSAGGQCSGSPASLGHNLFGDGTCGSGPGDIVRADPRLGPLAANGGPTRTHRLLDDSPALDAGDGDRCAATDQRGGSRPQEGGCDIGAFERGVRNEPGPEPNPPPPSPSPSPSGPSEPGPGLELTPLSIISHRNTVVTDRGALIKIRCMSTDRSRCKGGISLQPTNLSSRLQGARTGSRVGFDLAAGESKNLRVPVPAATARQLARRRTAVVRAVARLDDGTVVRRLLTLFGPR